MSDISKLINKGMIKDGSVFFDLGANMGQEIQGILDSGIDVEIHSFEPHPIFTRMLIDKFGNHPRITINSSAAWIVDEDRDFYFKKSKENLNGGATLISTKGNISRNITERVRCIDIAKYIENLGKDIDIFKIDVEGAEYHILDHIEKTGALSKIDKIFVEDHSRKISDNNWEKLRSDVIERYKEIGKDIYSW